MLGIRKLKRLFRNGGFTATLKGNRIKKKSGYCVSLTNNKDLDIKRLIGSLYRLQLSIKGYNLYIGGWVNEGIYYLDYTIIEPDKQKALKMASMFNQKAIYDLKTNSEIFV